MKKSKLLVLLSSIFLLSSCGSKEIPAEEVKIYEVKVNPTELTLTLGEDTSKFVNYNVFGQGNFSKDVEVTSEAELIATAKKATEGQSIIITPVFEGETIIHVKSVADETKAASIKVTVNPEKEIIVNPEVSEVLLDTKNLGFKIGDEPKEVKISVLGKGDYEKGVTINSDHPEIASVSVNESTDGGSFTITPESEGRAAISVTSKKDTTKGATVNVLVEKGEEPPVIEDIIMTPISKSLLVEEGFDINVTAPGDVTWTIESEVEDIVELSLTSNTGTHVKALKKGTAKVVASSLGKKAICNISITEQIKDVRTLYVTNNNALNYEDVYLYTWNSETKLSNNEWPGVKLTNKYLNYHGEECYRFDIDIYKYDMFLFNNGSQDETTFKKTPDCSYRVQKDYDNIYFTSDGEGNLSVNFATFKPYGPSVKFVNENVELYNGKSLTAAVESMAGDVVYSVTSGGEYIEITDYNNSGVSFNAKAVGDAVITATIPAALEYEEVSATLHVKVLDASGIKTYYFSNNGYVNYDQIYFYAWNSKGLVNKAWPGEKLDNYLINTLGERCYVFEADPDRYESFILNDNNSHQTEDISFASFGENDNVFPNGSFDESGHAKVSFAKFIEKTYSVSFEESNINLYNNKNKTVNVTASDDVTYSVKSGGEYVKIIASDNSKITLGFLAEGISEIEAKCGDKSAILKVTAINEEAPKNIRTFYYADSDDFVLDDVYIYAYGNGGIENAPWPGVKIEPAGTSYGDNNQYQFDLDLEDYSYFIINNNDDVQTVDIKCSEVPTSDEDCIYFDKLDVETGKYSVSYHSKDIYVLLEPDSLLVYKNTTKFVSVRTGLYWNYQIVSGSEFISVSKEKESIGVTYIAPGSAEIKISCGDESETIYVEVIDEDEPSKIKKYFFTDNLNWGTPYIYVFKDATTYEVADPGKAMTFDSVNEFGQNVYYADVDSTLYDKIYFSDGNHDINLRQRTRSIELIEFEKNVKDAVWVTDLDSKTNTYDVGFWTCGIDVSFEDFDTSHMLIKLNEERYFNVFHHGVKDISYTITQGEDIISIISYSDDGVKVKGIKEGVAKIKASSTFDGKEYYSIETIQVKDMKYETYYFRNDLDWENVYVYNFDFGKYETIFPGTKCEKVGTDSGHDVYAIKVDFTFCPYIIINDGTNNNETITIKKDDFIKNTANAVYPGTVQPAYCEVVYWNFEVHSHNYVNHVCACGEVEEGYSLTKFVVNYETYAQGDLYFLSDLKGWTANESTKMTWTEGNDWTFEIIEPVNTVIEYKFYTDYGGGIWEPFEGNRTTTLSQGRLTKIHIWGVK